MSKAHYNIYTNMLQSVYLMCELGNYNEIFKLWLKFVACSKAVQVSNNSGSLANSTGEEDSSLSPRNSSSN